VERGHGVGSHERAPTITCRRHAEDEAAPACLIGWRADTKPCAALVPTLSQEIVRSGSREIRHDVSTRTPRPCPGQCASIANWIHRWPVCRRGKREPYPARLPPLAVANLQHAKKPAFSGLSRLWKGKPAIPRQSNGCNAATLFRPIVFA